MLLEEPKKPRFVFLHHHTRAPTAADNTRAPITMAAISPPFRLLESGMSVALVTVVVAVVAGS